MAIFIFLFTPTIRIYIFQINLLYMTKLDPSEILPFNGKFTFLVGAGCSINKPASLPAGREMMEILIQFSCAASEREDIQRLIYEGLRFEQLVEIIRNNIDPNLKIIDYFGLSTNPNENHAFLERMIKRGNHVITTNFDFLIELALMRDLEDKSKILPVITEQDFKKYSNPDQLVSKGFLPVYKIHGSTKNIITGEDTRESLIATIQAFGAGKSDGSIFQLERFKRDLFNNIMSKRILVVMGYSGSDDFDVVPTLKLIPNLKKIVWINHCSTSPPEFKTCVEQGKSTDKVDEILGEIHQKNKNIEIYRVNGKTEEIFLKTMKSLSMTFLAGSLLKEISVLNGVLGKDNLVKPIEPLKKWLRKEVHNPDAFEELKISSEIYIALSKFTKASGCARKMVELGKEEKNSKWLAVSHNLLGEIMLNSSGDNYHALQDFEKALILLEKGDRTQLKARILNNIGQSKVAMGKIEDGLEFIKLSYEIFKEIDDIQGIAQALTNIWEHQFEDEKEYTLEDTLKSDDPKGYKLKSEYDRLIFRKMQKSDEEKRVSKLMHDYNYITEIGELLTKLGDLKTIAYFNKYMAESAIKTNNLEGAAYFIQQGIQIMEELDDPKGKVSLHSSWGKVLLFQGKLDEAYTILVDAYRVSKKRNFNRELVEIATNLGLLKQQQGKLRDAQNYFTEAYAISTSLRDHLKIVNSLKNIVSILKAQENHKGALIFLKMIQKELLRVSREETREFSKIKYEINQLETQLKNLNHN